MVILVSLGSLWIIIALWALFVLPGDMRRMKRKEAWEAQAKARSAEAYADHQRWLRARTLEWEACRKAEDDAIDAEIVAFRQSPVQAPRTGPDRNLG